MGDPTVTMGVNTKMAKSYPALQSRKVCQHITKRSRPSSPAPVYGEPEVHLQHSMF